MNRIKRKGVTLIELLIVVLILAALAAIAIPRISQSATNAKTTACDTNVDLVNSAIEMYNADNGSYPAAMTDVTQSTAYFPDDEPICPLGGTYSMNANNRVSCDH